MKYILDTSAIIDGFIPENSFTTEKVLLEVRDSESEFHLLSSISSGKLKVFQTREEYLREVERALKESGDNLSETDIEVVALALQLSGVVVSSDYGIQNTCSILGIEYLSVSQEGIKITKRWRYLCRGCGREYSRFEKRCKDCGCEVKKVEVEGSS